MTQNLIIDAAYPPSPAQWVDDMNAVGAAGGLVYVWGPILNYSVNHVVTARSNGKIVVPVVVPGNDGPTWDNVHNRLNLFGFTNGPALYDFELGSEPTNTWWQQHAQSAHAAGFVVDRYGTTSELGNYSPEDQDWIAQWIRTGVLDPLPTLQAGRVAWQFVNDIMINGRQYDASVIADSFIQGAFMLTPEDIDAVASAVMNKLDTTAIGQLVTDVAQETVNGTVVGPKGVATQLPAILSGLAAIQTAIANLQVPPANLQPILDVVTRIENALKGA